MPAHHSLRINRDGVVVRIDGNPYLSVDLITATSAFYGLYLPASGLLPPALRWMSPDACNFIFERPPSSIDIGYKPAKAGGGSRVGTYRINLPWLVYRIGFVGDRLNVPGVTSSVYARPGPIAAERDLLYYTGLPNLGGGHQFCLGEGYRQLSETLADQPKNTVARALLAAVNVYWTTEFNLDTGNDIGRLPKQALEAKATTYGQYFKLLAATAPAELCSWDWQPVNHWDFSTGEVSEVATTVASLMEPTRLPETLPAFFRKMSDRAHS